MVDHGTTPTDAATIIGIGRATLYRTLQRLVPRIAGTT
jgi:hypothetical protein